MQSILPIAILLAFTYSGPARNADEAPSNADFKWQPPTVRAALSVPQPTVPMEMVSTIRVSKVLVELEETKMTAVQKHLGGSLGQHGHAGESLEWLCYYGSDADGRWALWLESSQVAGGAVDGFVLQRLDSDARMDQRCADLQSAKVELPIVLKLGMTEANVRKLLGAPTLKFRGTLVFQHEHTVTIHNQPYTASNTVYLVLRRGVLWAIQVTKGTTS